MKIGIITDGIDNNAAGIGTYVRELVSRIIAKDTNNSYYLIHHTKSNDPFYRSALKKKHVHEIIIPILNIPFGGELRKAITMKKVLESEKLDIVHETAQTGPFLLKSNFKKIVTVHDLAILRYPRTQNFKAYLYHKMIMPKIMRNADKIIAVSESAKNDIEELFGIEGRKISIVHEAVNNTTHVKRKDIDLIKKKNGLNDYFLFVGSIEPRKNLERTLQAYNKFRKKGKIQFVIATRKGWKNKKIYDEIKNSPYRKDIVIIRDLPNKELYALYAGAKACLFVSLYEGFGLPILEAMKNKCPVITSNTSSMPEVAGDAALKVNPIDVNAISNAMVGVLDKKIAKNLIIRGLKNIKRFSWDKAAHQTMSIYQKLK